MDRQGGPRLGLGAFAPAGIRDRFQWGGYGFVAGLAIGLLLGVFFYGTVSFILRYGLVALLLVPIIAVFFAWRNFSNRRKEEERERREAAEAEAAATYVIEARSEPVVERTERLAEYRER